MNLIKAFVRRPVTTVMMVMVFVVLGYVSYTRMTVDMMPEINFPMIQILSVYPGAGPEELESQMVKKIEDEVSNISDIKFIQSDVGEGFAFTMVRFKLGVDVDIKALDVKDKIELIKREFPDGAEDPMVSKFDPLSMPVVKVALISDKLDQRDLYELADKKIKNYFAQVSGVAKVEVLGGTRRQINVWVSLDKMAQYGLNITDLVKTLGQESLDIPSGNIFGKTREIGVRFKGEAKSVEEVENLFFYAPKHGAVKLSDVARVEDGIEQIKSVVRFKDREAVLLDIYKRGDGNTIQVADGIYAKIEDVKKILPEGVELFTADDTSKFIRDAVDNAISNIFLGVLFCSIILWIFLRNVRITFVAAVVIPTSILSAFLLMDAFGFTVNMLTMAALGISIGALVANAIVVLENISRHAEQGTAPPDAAVKGTSEIAVAVLAAAGTNIVVFTPIAFMGGIVGVLFFQFGLTVVFATIFSLIASFSLTPMLSSIFIRSGKSDKAPRLFLTRLLHAPLKVIEKILGLVQEAYSNTLHSVLRHPFITLFLTCFSISPVFFLFGYIGGEFFPSMDQGEILIKARLPKGATHGAAVEVISRIEDAIKAEIPELTDYTAQAGGETKGFDEAEVKVRLKDAQERERSVEDVIYDLQPALAGISGAEIFITSGQRGPGASDIDIEVFGPDFKTLVELSRKMREKALETGNFRAVFNTYRDPKDEVHFIPDAYRRANYKVPNVFMGMIMRYSVEGQKGAVLRVSGEEYEIKVRLEEEARNSTEDLKSYKVPTSEGVVPLSHLGEFKKTKGEGNHAFRGWHFV